MHGPPRNCPDHPPNSQFLFKIDKSPNLTAPLLQLPDITIIQELETCFLGITDEKNLSKLNLSGFNPVILDRVTGSPDRYFLVHLRRKRGQTKNRTPNIGKNIPGVDLRKRGQAKNRLRRKRGQAKNRTPNIGKNIPGVDFAP